MDSSITETFLNQIVNEFLKILNHCPSRLRKLKNYRVSVMCIAILCSNAVFVETQIIHKTVMFSQRLVFLIKVSPKISSFSKDNCWTSDKLSFHPSECWLISNISQAQVQCCTNVNQISVDINFSLLNYMQLQKVKVTRHSIKS